MAERSLVRVPEDDTRGDSARVELAKLLAGRTRPPYAPHGTRPNLATVAQVEAIRARMHVRDAAIVSLIAYAGLSANEVSSLRWSDVGTEHLDVSGRRVPLWRPVVDDLERRRETDGAADDDRVLDSDWQEWRRRCYAPGAIATGLGRMPPWGLHNTYVHLRLIEGATPAQVAVETGRPTPDYAIERARVAAADPRVPRSAEAHIRAARTGRDAPGTASGVS